MIIVRLVGGLGNQLFQYARARHAAEINKTNLKIDLSEFETYKIHRYSLSHFNIIESIATEKDLRETNEFKERHYHFDPDYKSIGDGVLLKGYWQSEKYFINISEIIKKEFQLKTAISDRGNEISMIIADSNSVSLHIRRSDYKLGSYSDQILDTLSVDYYYKVIEMLAAEERNLTIFVFSDDPQWVKDNLKLKFPIVYVDHNTAETNYEDLYLMSLCKNNIIANSSFSWWGAWLNNNVTKKVYAPKKWFNLNVRNINEVDVIPKTWIKV
jgi:hypothetical protein